MRMVDLIEKKRDGNTLSYEELKFIIDGYVNKKIPDYQMSAFLMAVYFQSMTDEEASNLALIMRDSGDVLDLSKIKGIKVDKHSTGGVGDKTSLVLGPIVAAMGINFAKMSGRGLGHTGGTIDKLEAIPGYNVSLSSNEFINQVNNIHIALVGQSGNLTPADKKIYALRDVTGSVPSIPLIASSIMSKKLASGADAICLDVKVGNGAFMKDIKSARHLASLMVNIGKHCNRKMTAILTNMDEPLGYAVGNSLEVIEAIDTLNGNGPKDLLDLCITIAAYLAVDANVVSSIDEGKEKAKAVIDNKKALDCFAKLVSNQGGDETYIYDKTKFKLAKNIVPVYSKDEGYVTKLDALKIGHIAMLLGAGRAKLDDEIDFEVGVLLTKKIGDQVQKNEVIAYLYANKDDLKNEQEMINEAFKIEKEKINGELILDIIR